MCLKQKKSLISFSSLDIKSNKNKKFKEQVMVGGMVEAALLM